jgi:hypothetical protein
MKPFMKPQGHSSMVSGNQGVHLAKFGIHHYQSVINVSLRRNMVTLISVRSWKRGGPKARL